MKWNGSFALVAGLASVLSGCAPASSFFALFNDKDKEFDARLVGEWRIQSGAAFKAEEESARIVFRRSEDGSDYEVTLFDFDSKGMNLDCTGRLIRLGNRLFIDFGTPDTDKRKFTEFPFPIIESHIFGPIQIDKTSIRIDFLNDDWVKKQSETGKLSLPTVKTRDGLVISASTEELRKFAQDHVEDADAFSEPYSLVRAK